MRAEALERSIWLPRALGTLVSALRLRLARETMKLLSGAHIPKQRTEANLCRGTHTHTVVGNPFTFRQPLV